MTDKHEPVTARHIAHTGQRRQLQKGIAFGDDIAELDLLVAILKLLGVPVARVVRIDGAGGTGGRVAMSLGGEGAPATSGDGRHRGPQRQRRTAASRR